MPMSRMVAMRRCGSSIGQTLEILDSFGCPGHAGGCMTTPHSIATDSLGNIYIGETWEGKRVQRFLHQGLRPQL